MKKAIMASIMKINGNISNVMANVAIISISIINNSINIKISIIISIIQYQ
jgi:hypothetical protein